MNDVDVLVVGSGPTGLALATELARFGLTYRLIDKNPRAAQWSQALVVQARTLEQFERYGYAERAVAQGRPVMRVTLHEGGRTIAHIPLTEIPSRFPFVLFLPQNQTEALMTEHLAGLGGRIERNVELLTFADEDDGVVARLRHADGVFEVVSARWLAGCDGAHSVVRAQLGVPFEGDTVPLGFYLGDFRMTGQDLPRDELRVYLRHGDVVFIAPLENDVYRIILADHGDTGAQGDDPPVALFEDAIRRCCDGADLRITEATWRTRFRINQRKAVRYGIAHTFVAGDAAHIHSPVGGQGMNTGIQDAANLAWKFAAVARGADATLLASYDEERGAVGSALLALTSRALALATSANPVVEVLRDLVVPIATALPAVRARAIGFVSETAIQYRGSSIVVDAGGPGALRAGDRAPDAEIVRAGRTEHLLDPLRTAAHVAIAIDVDDASTLRADLRDVDLTVVRSDALPDDAREAYGHGGMLHVIRPDGYLGFRGHLRDREALVAYAQRVGLAPVAFRAG